MAFSRNFKSHFNHGIANQGAGTEFLNIYDVTTAGTAEASKALVLNSSKGISTITSATITTLTCTTATITTLNGTGLVRTGYAFNACSRVKVGTTAGWVVGAANNVGTLATVAQSQTAGTLVAYLDGLHVGDTITGFKVVSSINSGGNTVTLDANLRSLTVAALATAADASIDSITQVSVTAATASSAAKTGLSTVVASGVQYYILLTATTAGSTTIELDSIEVTVTTS